MTHTTSKGVLKRRHPYLLALGLAIGSLALGGAAQAQSIAGTSHDLTTATEGQQAGNILGIGSGEICAYCHTPHAGDTSASAPLWNRNLASVGGFTRYSALNTTTLTGTEANEVGSISLACLSCHDGVQAMDTVINAPGRGASTNTGTTVMTGADNEFAVIGQDLRNDHPISIQFCGGGIDSTIGTDGSTVPSSNCNLGTDYNAPVRDTINSNVVWWLDTDETAGDGTANLGAAGDATRQRTDIFLYTRSNFPGAANDGTAQPSVECGSCHDPHVDSPDTTAEVNFMRISNEGSAVCLTCHNK